MTTALIGFAVLLTLSFLRVPIAISMLLVGFVGMSLVQGWYAALANVGETAFTSAINYELSVVPLFILMGNFVTRARLSEELYTASNAFLGHRKGGLAMATIVACGGFSAVCGSSLATAATMAKVAMPSMRRYGYDDGLAAGAIAAGGTLGILIPPSVLLVIYGILTQTSIGKLFAAGVIPGVIGILGYLIAVRVVITIWPHLGPPGERTAWPDRMRALRGVWGVILLFVFVMGGIYGGVFSPTEAAGIGAFGAFLFALARRSMNLRVFYEVLLESALTTAMLFMILIGALIFANFINYTDFPPALLGMANNFKDSPWLVVIAILIIYVLLGCVFESLSMILLTVPIFFPLIKSLAPGFEMTEVEVAVWYGIVVVIITEISLITPPVGLNVFVLRGVLQDVRTTTIFRGVTAYWIADLFRLALIVGLPALSLWLPSFVK
ncbi:MAG: TRAP transporter large permease [Rhodospirillaceae bacterium]|nr:TRAP transporter large permease [Rhodospirillaceae bacterium]MCY4239405.1 TRAP transporter large permease [Rhodospirillaceae bacterium]